MPMADDARISTALPRHPKTVKLHRRLGASGCWSLVCLFLWVADNRPDGNLEGLSGEDIEIAAGWSDEASAFVNALVEVRFLDVADGAYLVHDWPEHNPWAANRPARVEAARQAAKVRWERRNADRMPVACESHETAMPASPLLSSPLLTTHTTKERSSSRPRPTLDEVTCYCLERQNQIDPQKFIDHYEANGWKVGGRAPMKDWKAAIRTWETNGVNTNATTQLTKAEQRQQRQLAAVRSN